VEVLAWVYPIREHGAARAASPPGPDSLRL
jgi:hypothetical protein